MALNDVLIFLVFTTGMVVKGVVYNFTALGAVSDDFSEKTAWKNGELFNSTLAILQKGDVLLFPNTTFYVMGGIIAQNLVNVSLQFDGTIIFSNDIKSWPRTGPTQRAAVLECLHFINCELITFTSSGTGLIDGNGETWYVYNVLSSFVCKWFI